MSFRPEEADTLKDVCRADIAVDFGRFAGVKADTIEVIATAPIVDDGRMGGDIARVLPAEQVDAALLIAPASVAIDLIASRRDEADTTAPVSKGLVTGHDSARWNPGRPRLHFQRDPEPTVVAAAITGDPPTLA